MKKIVGYIRVSTTNQDLARQKKLIEDYASLNSYEVVDYISEKESGTRNDRTGYQYILSLTKNDTDIVLMTEVSRFSREADIMRPLNGVNDLIHKGIEVHFMNNDIEDVSIYKDVLSPEEIQILVREFAQANKEREKIVRRMKSGRDAKFLQFPNALMGKVPFGYKRVANPDYVMNKTPRAFKVRDENAEIVKQMYKWIIEGSTLKNVALRLQALGIKTNGGKDFDSALVASIINNPIYKGEWTMGQATIKWDGIVSEEEWNMAKESLKVGRIMTNNKVNFNALKGLIKCPCGHSMYLQSDHNFVRLKCTSKKDRFDNVRCTNGGTGYNRVVKACWNAVLCSSKDITFANETAKEIANLEAKIEGMKADRKARAYAIEQNNIRLDKIADTMFKYSEAMQARFEKQIVQIENENNELAAEIKAISKLINENKQLVSSLKDENTVFEDREYTEEQKSEIFHRLLEKVVYYSVAEHKGFIEVTFKNGLQIIYLLNASRAILFRLPYSFRLKDRKVVVREIKGLFPEDKEYTLDEVIDRYYLGNNLF